MIDRSLILLKQEMYSAKRAFHEAGGRYYAARTTDSRSGATREAARVYREAARPYGRALDNCEEYYLSLDRSAKAESELQHIRTFKHSLGVILGNLAMFYPEVS